MTEQLAVWADVLTAAVIGVFGVVLSLLQYRRANHERAERLLDHVSSGDIARARHCLGSQARIRAGVP